MSDLLQIPGIGRTFAKDFARIGITSIAQLRGKDPERLFRKLQDANASEHHATSRNYLYVIRLAVYYADGGRDPDKLRWSAWKSPDTSPGKPSPSVARGRKRQA